MSLRVIGLDRAFGGANERLQRAAVAAADELAEEGARFIKEKMREEGKTDSDLTAQAVRAERALVVAPGLVRSHVIVQPQQMVPAVVLERGRRPGRPVGRQGRERLAVWARRKARGMVDRIRREAELANMRRTGKKRAEGKAKDRQKAAEQSAAFLIARAIRRRGLRPFRYFARARHHLQTRAVGIYKRVLARIPRAGGAR